MDFAENAGVRPTKRNEWKSAWKRESYQSALEEAHFAVFAKKQRKKVGIMKVVARNAKVTEEKLRDLRRDLKKDCFLLVLEGLFFAIPAKAQKKTLGKDIVTNVKTFEKGSLGLKKSNLQNLFKVKGKGSMKDIKTTMSLGLKSSLGALQTFTFLPETLLGNLVKYAVN